MHSSDTAQIHFDDVRVPQRYRIGEEGLGFTYQMVQFQEERMYAALGALTGMQKTIDETIAYTRERKAFGRSILDNQVRPLPPRRTADRARSAARPRLERGRTLRRRRRHDATRPRWPSSKPPACQREVNDACLQYWGGMGFMDETPVSRRYRDGRLASIGGGADEVMLQIIAKHMGTMPGTRQRVSPPLHRPFKSVLIANRGEIAVRIVREAKASGLRAIAVYSDADKRRAARRGRRRRRSHRRVASARLLSERRKHSRRRQNNERRSDSSRLRLPRRERRLRAKR